jgi:hypothetical protein
MQPDKIDRALPSHHFAPGIYGLGAWTNHLHFAYDLIAALKPARLVELGVDRGESYFAFCQSAAENKTGTQCFGVDTWRGDQHAGGYDETTFAQVSAHNRENYEAFSTLIRSSFDRAHKRFASGSIDVLHLDGLHTEAAVRHDVEAWLPKIRPGGILLLHDVDVREREFGAWKIWEQLRERGRSWTFHDGPGLGVWQQPPSLKLPFLLETLFAGPNESQQALAEYYRSQANETQKKMAQQWRDGTIRQTPFAEQTVIQVFHTADGIHRENDSVLRRIGHDDWRDIKIQLPPQAKASPLRIDFVSPFTIIDIASLRLTKTGQTCFGAENSAGFDAITVAGDAQRIPHPDALRLKITGIDPQLYLPPLDRPAAEGPMILEMRLRVWSDSLPPDFPGA